MSAKLQDKIVEKLRESEFIRRVYAKVYFFIFRSYEREWNWHARSKRSAIPHMTNVENEEALDKRGEERAEELKKFIEPNSVVLDLGCGIGRVEKFLAPHCKEIHGVDISSKMIKLARKRIKYENVYFHKNNGRDLSIFSDKTFDFVFSIGVLPLIEKEDACFYMMEIHRILKENGNAYLHFTNILCDYSLNLFLSSAKEKYRAVTRWRYHTTDEVEKVTKGIGFKILSLETKSDWRDADGSCRHDSPYEDFSIWLLASK